MTRERLKRCYGYQRGKADLEQAHEFAKNAVNVLNDRAEDPQLSDRAYELAEELLELSEDVEKQLQKEEVPLKQ